MHRRLAREAGLEYVEIQNLNEFYDDNRYVNLWSHCNAFDSHLIFYEIPKAHTFQFIPLAIFELEGLFIFSNLIVAQRALFVGMLMSSGPNLIDPRGRLLPRSYDVLGRVSSSSFCHTS